MTNVLDILRLTPKTNCGECGFPTCMAFCVGVTTGKASWKQCPYIDESKAEEMFPAKAGNAEASGGLDPDTALLRELKQKIRDVDLGQRAKGLGARLIKSEGGSKGLEFTYLGRTVVVTPSGIVDGSGRELDPRDQILLYNYVFFGGRGELSGQWVGLESFPNSVSKVVTLRRYTEEKLSSYFEGRSKELVEACKKIGGKIVKPCHAEVCVRVPILPKVPVQVHFWDSDQEDGFPAKVKVLFDKRALDFLDIESLIFAAERMAEMMVEEES